MPQAVIRVIMIKKIDPRHKMKPLLGYLIIKFHHIQGWSLTRVNLVSPAQWAKPDLHRVLLV